MFKSDVTGRGKKKKQRVLVGRVLSFMLMSGGKNEMKQIILTGTERKMWVLNVIGIVLIMSTSN